MEDKYLNDSSEYLENIQINYTLVILLPLIFLIIFLLILITALIKSDETTGNISRILFYILSQFLLMPFLMLFILINIFTLSISVMFCKEAKYISLKKIAEFFDCVKCTCRKKINVIKVEKKIDYFGPNSNSEVDKQKKKERISNNSDSEKDKEIYKYNPYSNNPSNKEENNIIEEFKEEKKEFEIKEEKKENIDILDRESQNCPSNINNRASHYEISKIENKANESKEELKQNKVHILLNVNSNEEERDATNKNYNFNKPPPKRRIDKGKIMNFLGDVLVNKDNTPSYINFFQSIKQKSKERLENQNKSNNIVSPFK